MKFKVTALVLILFGAYLGYFIYASENNPEAKFPFFYGLDLDGGTHLTYRADTSQIPETEIDSAMDSLRQTVERRVNVFGVSEPIVHVENGSVFGNNEDDHRLIVELPGITDVTEAIDAIGKTPVLEFRLAGTGTSTDALLALNASSTEEEIAAAVDTAYKSTGLTGAYLKRALLQFDQVTGEPIVSLEFNKEGSDLFSDITRTHVGRILAIFLDGQILSAPVIRQEITNGNAQISGNFSIPEAKQLVQDLNFGALPLPVEVISTQTIGPSLGHQTLVKGVQALTWAFIIIAIFLIVLYRLPGLIASVSLFIYVALMLTLFKLIPVTITASGIAGFILSLGMAVDANILIFERLRDEMNVRNDLRESIIQGFKRAWLPIRDGNISSIISAVVLYWLSGTSLVKGFALVFGIGVLISMLTAVAVSRTLLLALYSEKISPKVFVPTFGRLHKKESDTNIM